MSELISVTRGSLDDLEAATQLFDDYRIFYGQSSDRDACRRFLKDRISNSESVIFLARLETRHVGFVQLYPSFSSIAMRPLWILNDLFVHESARKKGIGTALLQAAERFAEESHSVRLTLATGVENFSAQSLYKQLGWQRDDSYQHYLKPLDRNIVEDENV